MEGSSDFKLVWLEERGPGQKEENKKWRGPVTSSSVWLEERGPRQKQEIKKRRGPMPSSELGIRREGPTTTKK